ncbi:hypothetical protein PBRA_005136 [Plasmodiophora brassicae]|uniref:Major facilitator superfamily (MFS) profile domain-containing protein n=1 Tax=Plasmodiophora brassicae TaxID=37360 RepID=A0A0G4IMV4_PLABS|nr:hypothetical protein PBRA_005136 [Plasmodiophora brassicae]
MKMIVDETKASSNSDDISVDVSHDAEEDKVANRASSNRSWVLVSIFLILSTLLQSLKPSDAYIPFYFQYARHLSKDVINNAIYPFRSYAMLLGLLPVTILAESICVFGLICRWVTQFGLYYGPGLISLQLSYAVFGLSHATKIIYSAFTYRMVPVHVFHRITGYIRGANLLAHVLGGSLGQLIYMQNPPDGGVHDATSKLKDPFFLQFTISQVCVGIGAILFFAAISVHRRQGGVSDSRRMRPSLSLSHLCQLLRSVYATRKTILYSIWWCIAFGTVDLVWDYQSVLFLDMKQTVNYTGVVTSAARLGCAVAAMLSGRSRAVLKAHGVSMMSLGSIVISVGLLVSALTYDLVVSYIAYLALVMANEFCYCSATAEIAVATPDSLRGVVLLSNMIFAMVLQALLQFICGPQVLDVSIRAKYMTWAASMGLLGIFMLGVTLLPRRKREVRAMSA